MKSSYRVAIAGCHRMLARKPGGHNHAAGFQAISESRVVGVFDYDRDTRRQFVACWREAWGEVPAYDDYERMLEETQPDIVCVATRQTMHADQIEMAVQAGAKAVLCDKPLATSMSEVDRIVAACTNVPLALALDRRWNRHYRELRKLIAAGVIGRLQGLIGFGVPNLINHGCHWYDTMLLLAGDPRPVWVSGQLEDLSGEPEGSPKHLDPAGRVHVGLEDGSVLYVTPDGKSSKCGLSFEAWGDAGRLLMYQDGRVCFSVSDADAAVSCGPAGFFTPTSIDQVDGTGGLQDTSKSGMSSYLPIEGMVSELVEGVRTGRRTSCDLEQASRAAEIGFAAHLSSARDGARIALPLEDRSLRIESFKWGSER